MAPNEELDVSERRFVARAARAPTHDAWNEERKHNNKRDRSENDAEFTVEPARIKDSAPTTAFSASSGTATPTTASATPTPSASNVGSLVGDFPRKLGKDVAIDFIFVNFIDLMAASEARAGVALLRWRIAFHIEAGTRFRSAEQAVL